MKFNLKQVPLSDKICSVCGEKMFIDNTCSLVCDKLKVRRSEFKNKPDYVLSRAGVPKLFIEASKDDLENDSGRHRLACGEPKSCFFYGDCGTGKTYLSVILFREWFSRFIEPDKYNAAWAETASFISEIKDTFNDGNKLSENQIINKYSKYKLLVMDDLGVEKNSEWSASMLCQLINNRINNNNITIVTSNKTLAELSEYNERLASRLGGFVVQEITGVDRRLI